MLLANKAQDALAKLVEVSEWNDDRRRVLALVLEHLIQDAGDKKAVAALRRRAEKLERDYSKVVAECDKEAVIPVDMSPGLAERYGVNG